MMRFLAVTTFFLLSFQAQAEQTVVLISIDGFRHDYIELHGAPNIERIASQGVRSEGLIPVYPSKTFPNHLSIVTGQYPVNHGIVDNNFYDTERKQRYKMGDGVKDSTWLTTLPIWNLAEFQGVKAATFFWPESEARINGRTPSYYFNYSTPAPNQQRIDQMVQWLKLPEPVRPRLVTGYFSIVDTMGHRFGPDSHQVEKAVKHVDKLIGEFWQRIQNEVDVPVNLILVSDHGMVDIKADAMIDVSAFPIDESLFETVNAQTRFMIYANEETTQQQIDDLRNQLGAMADGRYFIETETSLTQLGVTDGPRTAAIILGTQAPASFTSRAVKQRRDGGAHGFHSSRNMDGLFIAAGPAIKHQANINRFSNIHIYPFMAELLGLKLMTPIDGDAEVLAPLISSQFTHKN
ncbi:ectonucleotide pyrophosphatase/phosphodiesterase [Pseudidiomarina gelatinasegens]|uniref:alkaline phosphatase family protein n=1 Tax=Pseudidiomarina gelatinasegens TaxID=2487740 RepID=UPI003A984AEA